MRLCYIVVATALAFIASRSGTLAMTAESRTSLVRAPGAVGGGRLLRVTTTTEERDVFSQMAEEVSKWVTTTTLLNLGKTDDEVKKILGLEKLSGQTLKTHPKFQVFEEFVSKFRERKVNELLNKDTTTDEVWRLLNLDDLSKKLTTDQLKETDALKFYVQYVNKLDDDIAKFKRADFEPDNSSPQELAVKIHIWAKAKRPPDYVLEIMGKNALKGSENHKYYKEYLQLIKGSKQIVDF
ncbi:hypothetical protein PHYPSEUDO_007871 [Phytophthora pseudosyringae]|uniref:RxLR effector protein n=1 Tax=Phytophthora pseudosyringae TaxID=221518 RepID=A0A8T1VIK9_9STRA|nr:hypothetical protein PHYPSEUDO_007871 [Phytophthora pseudosyringae]